MTWSHQLRPRWNWLDNGLLPLLLALLRFCWLWPWLGLLRDVLSPSFHQAILSPVLIIALPVISLILARLVASRETGPDEPHRMRSAGITVQARLGVALAGLLVILVALWWQLYRTEFSVWDRAWPVTLGRTLIHLNANELPAPVLILLALIYLWLRGLLDAMKTLGHDDIWGTFVAGIVMLVLYLVTMAINDFPIAASSINLIVLFFAVGLTALALSGLKITVGLDRALGRGQRRASKTPALNRYWLLSVTVTVAILLGLGLLVSLLVAPEQVAALLHLVNVVLSTVWDWISLVIVAISYLLFVIGYLVASLLEPLVRWLMSLLGTDRERQPLQMMSPLAAPAPITPTAAAIPDIYRWIALGIFGVVVLLIFALVLRRLWAAQTEETDEERESILSADLLQDQLKKLWQKLFGGLRSVATLNPFLSLAGEHDTRRAIRTTYQNLLAAAIERGQARPPEQTPREYQHQLADHLPETTGLLTTLTERYNHARYAEEPPAPDAVAEVEQAWKKVQETIAAQEPPPEES
ncbi:MAG: DUF4129 domain-containing protein [Chloroflexi bacterium]|nr:DUF4129 domain-containing protein [Chloroflexota bacterium]